MESGRKEKSNRFLIWLDYTWYKMLNKVAYKIAKKIVECSDADKEEIYIYGLELIISTFFGLVSILLISCLLSRFTSGLVFISVFVPLRLFTGGFHAATYNRCFVISNISYLLILFVRDITLEIFPMWTWLFFVNRYVLLYYKECTNC